MSAAPDRIPRDLVRTAAEGDESSIRELVGRVYPMVRRWALVKTGDLADADDLTQDVMVRMVRKLNSYGGGAEFETWLYAMTRNAAMDRFRKRKRESRLAENPKAIESLLPDPRVDPQKSVEVEELGTLLRMFFSQLPDRQREVFDLVELQGRTPTEVAGLLGLEPVSVRAHLFKARRRLRGKILDERPELAQEMP